MWARPALGAAIVAVALAVAPSAQALDTEVESFDGTTIVTHFYPAGGLAPGERAPTILIGHGWGGTGEDADGSPAPFLEAGYNVLTWDARGFGGSGGTVMIDHPRFEERDAEALIDFVAQRPEAKLDGPNDPRVGMSGGSYGGGIQLLTAAKDHHPLRRPHPRLRPDRRQGPRRRRGKPGDPDPDRARRREPHRLHPAYPDRQRRDGLGLRAPDPRPVEPLRRPARHRRRDHRGPERRPPHDAPALTANRC